MRPHVHTATVALIIVLFGDVLVAVPVVICLSSIMATTNMIRNTGTTNTVLIKYPNTLSRIDF